MKLFDHILQGSEATEKNAVSHAKGFDFMECTVHEGSHQHMDYVDTYNGVNIYYNTALDTYHFSPSPQED